MTGAFPPATGRVRAKRVARACDYCRRKRLKCTPDQRPCFNCQLYSAQCTSSDRGRRAAISQPTSHAQNNELLDGGNGGSTQTIHHSPQEMTTNPGLPIEPSAVPRGAFDYHVSTSPWPQDQGQGLHVDSNPQEFGNVLQQLDIGASLDFWELDGTMLDDMRSVAHNMMGTGSTIPETNALSLMDNSINESLPTPRPAWPVYTSSSSSPTSNSTNGKVSSIDSLTRNDADTPGSQPSVLPGVFIRRDKSMANYIGLNSVGATLALCLKDALESQKLPMEPQSLGFLIEAGAHVDRVGLSSLLDLTFQELPPRDMAVECIEAYFANLNVFYPIIEKESFQARSELLYGPNRSELDILDYSLFYLVISIGALSIGHNSEHPEAIDQLSRESYHHAWSMIHDAIALPCEASLQVLLLHIINQLYYVRCGIAWVFCGLAIRIAQSIGLHPDARLEADISDNQLQRRARLWWIMFSFDASLSLSQGRPPGLGSASRGNETSWVGEIDSDLSSSTPQLSHIYEWIRGLSWIQNSFCHVMQSRSTISSRLEAIAKVDADLVAWKDSLPVACRPDHLIVVSSEMYSHILLIHLEYLNLLRAIHWAAIVLRPNYSGDHGKLSTRILASESFCVEAARSFIQGLNNNMGRDPRGRKMFVVSFHLNNYMAAIAVIYRSISKNPASFSARADLEHLRAGKAHLERDSPDNIVGPAIRALFDNMLSSAQDLVWKYNGLAPENQ